METPDQHLAALKREHAAAVANGEDDAAAKFAKDIDKARAAETRADAEPDEPTEAKPAKKRQTR